MAGRTERAPPEFVQTLPRGFTDLVIGSMFKFCPTLVPTTYEAAEEYLREEKLKPKGHRDLRRYVGFRSGLRCCAFTTCRYRESCYLSFTSIEECKGKPTVYLTETQTLIPVAPGTSLPWTSLHDLRLERHARYLWQDTV